MKITNTKEAVESAMQAFCDEYERGEGSLRKSVAKALTAFAEAATVEGQNEEAPASDAVHAETAAKIKAMQDAHEATAESKLRFGPAREKPQLCIDGNHDFGLVSQVCAKCHRHRDEAVKEHRAALEESEKPKPRRMKANNKDPRGRYGNGTDHLADHDEQAGCSCQIPPCQPVESAEPDKSFGCEHKNLMRPHGLQASVCMECWNKLRSELEAGTRIGQNNSASLDAEIEDHNKTRTELARERKWRGQLSADSQAHLDRAVKAETELAQAREHFGVVQAQYHCAKDAIQTVMLQMANKDVEIERLRTMPSQREIEILKDTNAELVKERDSTITRAEKAEAEVNKIVSKEVVRLQDRIKEKDAEIERLKELSYLPSIGDVPGPRTWKDDALKTHVDAAEQRDRAEKAEKEAEAYQDSASALLRAFPLDLGDWPITDGAAAVATFREWLRKKEGEEEWSDTEPCKPDTVVGAILAERKRAELAEKRVNGRRYGRTRKTLEKRRLEYLATVT